MSISRSGSSTQVYGPSKRPMSARHEQSLVKHLLSRSSCIDQGIFLISVVPGSASFSKSLLSAPNGKPGVVEKCKQTSHKATMLARWCSRYANVTPYTAAYALKTKNKMLVTHLVGAVIFGTIDPPVSVSTSRRIGIIERTLWWDENGVSQ